MQRKGAGVDKDDEVQGISPLLASKLLDVLSQAKPCQLEEWEKKDD